MGGNWKEGVEWIAGRENSKGHFHLTKNFRLGEDSSEGCYWKGDHLDGRQENGELGLAPFLGDDFGTNLNWK